MNQLEILIVCIIRAEAATWVSTEAIVEGLEKMGLHTENREGMLIGVLKHLKKQGYIVERASGGEWYVTSEGNRERYRTLWWGDK